MSVCRQEASSSGVFTVTISIVCRFQQLVEGVGVWLCADRRLLAAACSLSLSVLCAVFNSWLKVLGCGCVQIGDFLQQRVRCEYCGEEASLVEHRDSTALSAHRNFLYHKSHSVQGREALVTRVCVCVCESVGRGVGGGHLCMWLVCECMCVWGGGAFVFFCVCGGGGGGFVYLIFFKDFFWSFGMRVCVGGGGIYVCSWVFLVGGGAVHLCMWVLLCVCVCVCIFSLCVYVWACVWMLENLVVELWLFVQTAANIALQSHLYFFR